MKKNLNIKLTFIDNTPESQDENAIPLSDGESEISEFITEAEYIDGERCELLYQENEELGMGNSKVKITWLADDPQVIAVMRTGEIETVMTFEPGRRHISVYNMPEMTFELCTRAMRVNNSFDGKVGGELYVDYIIEIRGGFAGRRKMRVEVLP